MHNPYGIRSGRGAVVVLWCVATLGIVLPASAAADTDSYGAVTYLYVAEQGAGAVAVFRSDSSGPTVPARVISGASTGLQDPWGVTLDSSNQLYVQNFLGPAATEVFEPGVQGAATPSRELKGVFRDSPAVAVDSAGQVYAARFQQGVIEVFAPGASSGDRPTRTIQTDGVARSLAVDGADNLIAAVQGRSGGNAIEVFSPGADGAAAPIRTVTGPDTGLGRSGGFVGRGESVVLTYGNLTGRIYAAVTGASPDLNTGSLGSESHVSVFAGDADGDGPPLRTIKGPSTGLTGATLTGIADNPASGNIWVMAGSVGADGVIAKGEILDFHRLANGDAAPIRQMTDAMTGFSDVQGIAFGTK